MRLQSQEDALSERRGALNQIVAHSKQLISEKTLNINNRLAAIATISKKIDDMGSTADHLQNNVVEESAACMTAMLKQVIFNANFCPILLEERTATQGQRLK